MWPSVLREASVSLNGDRVNNQFKRAGVIVKRGSTVDRLLALHVKEELELELANYSISSPQNGSFASV